MLNVSGISRQSFVVSNFLLHFQKSLSTMTFELFNDFESITDCYLPANKNTYQRFGKTYFFRLQCRR
jgi:hypothetical protein